MTIGNDPGVCRAIFIGSSKVLFKPLQLLGNIVAICEENLRAVSNEVCVLKIPGIPHVEPAAAAVSGH